MQLFCVIYQLIYVQICVTIKDYPDGRNAMDVLSQIRVMQAVRNLNNSQTAALLGSSRQNFSNKCDRNNFSVNELQKIADVLGFDMDIVFTDRENSNVKSSDEDKIGKLLFDLRTDNNLSQSDVADKLGTKIQKYIRYETGLEPIPLDILLKACKLYNVSQSYFGINSDLVAVGNKGYTIQNTETSETLDVTNIEFEMVKKIIEAFRGK